MCSRKTVHWNRLWLTVKPLHGTQNRSRYYRSKYSVLVNEKLVSLGLNFMKFCIHFFFTDCNVNLNSSRGLAKTLWSLIYSSSNLVASTLSLPAQITIKNLLTILYDVGSMPRHVPTRVNYNSEYVSMKYLLVGITKSKLCCETRHALASLCINFALSLSGSTNTCRCPT